MTQIKKSYVSITHMEDLDGIGSQAILLRKFPNLFCIRTFYSSFNENVIRAFKIKTGKLFITDIGFNESYRNIYSILNKMDVCWIDHHSIAESDELELKNHIRNFIHSYDDTVAAELTQKMFLPDDKVAKKIAKLAHNRDNSIENQEADRIQAIIDINLENTTNSQKIVELLSKGDFENIWYQNQYEKYLELEEDEYNLLEKRIKEYEINNYKIIFSFSSLFKTGKQTRYLLKKFGPDIVFGINHKFHLVSIRSQTIDTNKIAKEFGGGGHFDRAGFTYYYPLDAKGELSKQFINETLKVVKKILEGP